MSCTPAGTGQTSLLHSAQGDCRSLLQNPAHYQQFEDYEEQLFNEEAKYCLTSQVGQLNAILSAL